MKYEIVKSENNQLNTYIKCLNKKFNIQICILNIGMQCQWKNKGVGHAGLQKVMDFGLRFDQ